MDLHRDLSCSRISYYDSDQTEEARPQYTCDKNDSKAVGLTAERLDLYLCVWLCDCHWMCKRVDSVECDC